MNRITTITITRKLQQEWQKTEGVRYYDKGDY